MAKLTNKFNLPQQIVSAIMRDPYSMGDSDISVTQLIKPPRIVQLQRRHAAEIVEDASDRIWALLGQTCHGIIERSDQTGAIHEERISVMVSGWKVSGASDCYVEEQFNFDTGKYEKIPETIRDYKLIKVMAGGFDHPNWEQQTNLLAYLWRRHGFIVQRLEIVAIFRDWSKVLYERGEKDYTPPVKIYKQKLWTMEQQEQFLLERVSLHKLAMTVEDKFLPLCTPEDQWRRPPKWAVMHPKKKKAARLLNSIDEAEKFISGITKDQKAHYIEHRPAVAMRCEMFCDVASFCDQYKAEKEAEQKAQEAA